MSDMGSAEPAAGVFPDKASIGERLGEYPGCGLGADSRHSKP